MSMWAAVSVSEEAARGEGALRSVLREVGRLSPGKWVPRGRRLAGSFAALGVALRRGGMGEKVEEVANRFQGK